MRNLKLFFFLSIISPAVFATTTIVNHSKNFETYSTITTGATIYAGTTDNTTRSSCTTNSTCNTCSLDTTALTASSVCGLNEVLPANTFYVTIRVKDSTLTSTATASFNNTDTTAGSDPAVSSASTFANNSDLTISTTWAEICSSAGVTSSCTGSFSKTFRVGYGTTSDPSEYVEIVIKHRYVASTSANAVYQSFGCTAPISSEGFCYFYLYPGDNKTYVVPEFNANNTTGVVADLSGGTATSDVSGMKYKYIRLLYIDGTSSGDTQGAHAAEFNQALPYATNLNFDATTFDVSPRKVTGLQNDGLPYLFISASVDQAGLVANYSDPTQLCTGTYGVATDFKTMETQCVIPQKVYGLLDGQECFIATASYGSAMAPEVETFRQFRGKYLLNSELGRIFVRTYYKYSPPLAEFISHSDELRFISRAALFPVLLFVKMALLIGFLPAFFIFTGLIFSFFYFLRRARKVAL